MRSAAKIVLWRTILFAGIGFGMKKDVFPGALPESDAIFLEQFIKSSRFKAIIIQEGSIGAAEVDQIWTDFLTIIANHIPDGFLAELNNGMLLRARWMI